ncbi:hypothetical protein [Nocardia grenadensis]|uniref:hypothetical protein n=1 Tax=Nocardia grenadensis TaxID=931537 RepID=UPI0007A3F482|nr:hypothetical protein [Nocardia grenadensis]
MSRRSGTSASDPTARIASAAVDHDRATRAAGWRAHYDPHRRPVTDEERAEAEALGWEAWRTAQAYRAYRHERFGVRA